MYLVMILKQFAVNIRIIHRKIAVFVLFFHRKGSGRLQLKVFKLINDKGRF